MASVVTVTRSLLRAGCALNPVRLKLGVNFGDFDADGDNMVDMGDHDSFWLPAWGSRMQMEPGKDRIWSHRWLL
jgi:hypothetical protein